MKKLFCLLCCLAALWWAVPAAWAAEETQQQDAPLTELSDALPYPAQQILDDVDFSSGNGFQQGIGALWEAAQDEMHRLLRQMLGSGEDAELKGVKQTITIKNTFFNPFKNEEVVRRCVKFLNQGKF